MTDYTIRNLHTDDYNSVISVIKEWWGGRDLQDMLPKLFFVHFSDTSFIAEYDGKLLGFVIGFVSQAYDDEAYIHFAGVSPISRKKGIARSLYETFFEVVKNRGCKKVTCVTSPVNKTSISFHMHMGFTPKKSKKEIDGISVFENYDGENGDRVLLQKLLAS
ncbi:MAG: GNAT family N-acetyltransferase [Gammaproteobacteria bacterium]|nr:GNAT family N-acetyltransferase [Gammaproteobacteria bacterium]